MPRSRLNYEEGTFFALPLRNGGYGVGVVARMPRGGKVLLGYFFGRKYAEVPDLSEVQDFAPLDAVTVQRFGDLGLITNVWTVIGKPPGWDRTKWPIPIFARRCAHTGNPQLVVYRDENPNSNPQWIPATEEDILGLEAADLHGYGSMEITLSRIIEGLGV